MLYGEAPREGSPPRIIYALDRNEKRLTRLTAVHRMIGFGGRNHRLTLPPRDDLL